MTFNVQKVAVGDAMPVLQLAPISRTTLALFLSLIHISEPTRPY